MNPRRSTHADLINSDLDGFLTKPSGVYSIGSEKLSLYQVLWTILLHISNCPWNWA